MFHPGDVLRKWRNKRGIGLVELAKISKVDKGTISKIENGGSYRQPTFEKLCSAFGKTPFDVYRELVEGAIHTETSAAAFTCKNPDHAKIHSMLDDILNTNKSMGELIIGNIRTFYAALMHSSDSSGSVPLERTIAEAIESTPGSPEKKHGPFANKTQMDPGDKVRIVRRSR